MQEAQGSGESYIGVNEEVGHYRGVVAFIINGLEETVPMVIRLSPETAINGQWLAQEFAICISRLSEAEFKVRGTVTYNHSINVNVFKSILSEKDGDKQHFVATGNEAKTFLFHDSVQLIKNIRNNLLG